MDTPETTTNQFEKYIIYTLVLLSPIIVFSSFANAFTTPQLVFVTFLLGAVLVIKSLRSITKNSFAFSASSFDLPVILLGSAYILSGILQSPNKMEAFFLPGTSTTIVVGVLLFFVINQLSGSGKNWLRIMFFFSTLLVSIIVMLASTGVLNSFSSLPAFVRSTSFTTLGGPLQTLVMIVASLPVGLTIILDEKDKIKKIFFSVAFCLIVLAGAMSLFNVLPGKEASPQLPGFKTSWFVAVDSLKQNPLLGVGPGNYLTAFNRFRPIAYNETGLWATRFTSAQSFLLTSITEAGLVGGASLLLILYFVIKIFREHLKKGSKHMLTPEAGTVASLMVIIISLLLFPATPTLIFIFFILLAVIAHTSVVSLNMFNHTSHGGVPFAARIPVLIATVPIIAGVLIFAVEASRVLSADMTYKRALNYIVADDGKNAYDTLQKAINANPYVDRYRVSYAQINLALANSIAKNKDISEQDRATISQLVQQAIREGKLAVALNPQRAGNWEVLASIYRAIIPLAQGADAFASQTYTEAIALDPLNPNTRIALGGIYYAAKAYEDAIDVFKLAVATKPNHANAHYNLAVAYREKGDLDRAISEMSAVLSLVDKTSEDFTVASKALTDLQSKKKAELPKSANLTPPSGNEPGLVPPLVLPGDATPPEPEATPTPQVTTSPSPTVTPTLSPLP